MYSERPSRFPGAVLWRQVIAAAPSAHRVLPDGCMDLIWTDGELIVAGPDTQAHIEVSAPGARSVALRFGPGSGPAVLGVPADAVCDQRVPLSQLWPATRVRNLAARLDSAPGREFALEEAMVERLADAGPDPVMLEVAALLGRGASVAEIADAVGLGERQLHRRSLAAFGYGPKMLARVLRMNRAVALSRVGTPLATVAALGGYADQAHLTREVKALAGVPIGALTR